MESRALFELGGVFAASPLLRMVGRGDEHPVLVLPGFMADDASTAPLRWMLRGQGYWVHGWQLGRNLGPSSHVVAGLAQRLDALHDHHARKVSIVGWSLGGIYARRLASRAPGKVRQVITLGSPFRLEPGQRSAVSSMYDRLNARREHPVDAGVVEVPESIPATAIYTRTDGVVRWWQCIEQIGPRRENIEVRGSHSGLGFNPAVIYAVSDRLAQRPDEWRPFRAPLALRHLFPEPADHREPAVAAP